MKRWLIADTHFSHTNIIRYCNRPFNNVEEMNETLIKRWNSVVGKDDVVYHLGDVAFKTGEIKDITDKLNGRKVLIMGNHDTKTPEYYLKNGFAWVSKKPIMIEPGVILMHEPISKEFIVPNYLYFFGHVHDKMCELDKLNNCRCVSVERNNYYPLNFDAALKEMASTDK